MGKRSNGDTAKTLEGLWEKGSGMLHCQRRSRFPKRAFG